MRTLLICVAVLICIALAFALRKPEGTMKPASVNGTPSAAQPDTETDWSKWLSIVAGILTAVEVAIRTILQILAKRSVKETPDVATPTAPPINPSG